MWGHWCVSCIPVEQHAPSLYWPKTNLRPSYKFPAHVIYIVPPFTRSPVVYLASGVLSLSWRRLGDLPAPAALRQVPRSSSGPSPKSSQQVCAPLLFPSRCAKLRTQTLADTVLAICVWIGSNFRCIHVVLCFLTWFSCKIKTWVRSSPLLGPPGICRNFSYLLADWINF